MVGRANEVMGTPTSLQWGVPHTGPSEEAVGTPTGQHA